MDNFESCFVQVTEEYSWSSSSEQIKIQNNTADISVLWYPTTQELITVVLYTADTNLVAQIALLIPA